MILSLVVFLVVFLAPLFFIPTLRLQVCPTDSEGHQKTDEGYTTKDTESYGFTLRFYVRPKGEKSPSEKRAYSSASCGQSLGEAVERAEDGMVGCRVGNLR